MVGGSSRRIWVPTVTGLLGAALLAGCALPSGGSSGGEPTAGTVSTEPSTSAPVSPSPAASTDDPVGVPSVSVDAFPTPTPTPTPTPSPTPAPSPTETSASADGGLKVTRARIRGRADRATWDVDIPVFSGPPAAAEANRRVRAAVGDLVAQVRKEARQDDGVERTMSGEGTVSTNDGRTVQVVIDYVDYLAGTARPASYVSTTVVDVRRSRPVLLTQAVQNPPEALRLFRTEVVKAARTRGEPTEAAGLTPRLTNWANWQSSSDGLTFWFDEYQLGGAGIRSYTVPWSRAELVLSAYGEALLR